MIIDLYDISRSIPTVHFQRSFSLSEVDQLETDFESRKLWDLLFNSFKLLQYYNGLSISTWTRRHTLPHKPFLTKSRRRINKKQQQQKNNEQVHIKCAELFSPYAHTHTHTETRAHTHTHGQQYVHTWMNFTQSRMHACKEGWPNEQRRLVSSLPDSEQPSVKYLRIRIHSSLRYLPTREKRALQVDRHIHLSLYLENSENISWRLQLITWQYWFMPF